MVSLFFNFNTFKKSVLVQSRRNIKTPLYVKCTISGVLAKPLKVFGAKLEHSESNTLQPVPDNSK